MEMKIKATTRYRYIPIKMAKMKKKSAITKFSSGLKDSEPQKAIGKAQAANYSLEPFSDDSIHST